jgi:hypothetical protein
MHRALIFQKAIWGKMPGAAFQRRLPILSMSYIRIRSQSSCISATDHSAPSLELVAASPLATQLVAHYFASSILPGDAYLLYGEVGAGKSHFRYAKFPKLYQLSKFSSSKQSTAHRHFFNNNSPLCIFTAALSLEPVFKIHLPLSPPLHFSYKTSILPLLN